MVVVSNLNSIVKYLSDSFSLSSLSLLDSTDRVDLILILLIINDYE